jgi:hypothetical protein
MTSWSPSPREGAFRVTDTLYNGTWDRKFSRYQRGKEVSEMQNVFITTQLVFKVSIAFQQMCFLPLVELGTYVLPGRRFLQILKSGLEEADSQFLTLHV